MAQQAPSLLPSGSANEPLIRFDKKSPVRFLGLAAVGAVAAALFAILWPLRWSLVALWVALEVCFFVFYFRPRYGELNAQPRPHHRPERLDAMAAFERTLRYFRANPRIDYKHEYAGKWFLGAPFEQIKKGNAEEFLAYAFWYRTLQEMRDEGRGHVPAQMVAQLEQAWGLTLAPGYTPGLRFMGHLQEPLKAQWRPLAFYLCTEGVGWFARQMLQRWGFKQHAHQGMSYFTLNLALDAAGKAVSATRTNSSLLSLSDGSVSSSASSATAAVPAAPAAPAFAAKSSKSSPPSTSAPVPIPAAAAGGSGSGMARAKSSPFQMVGLDWAAQLAANEDSLAASITAASAVHSPPAAPRNPFFAAAARAARAAAAVRSSRRKAAAEARAQQQAQRAAAAAASAQPPLVPWLSTHTSVMLKALPNKLEQALSDGLGSKDMPVLFLHGVGGLAAYLEMLLQVMALGHPVIVVQFDAVAMRLSRVRTADEVMESVLGVLDKLGVEEACVIGHSYGTFVAGRMARLHRNRVHSLCLIDPVCFGMFMPQLLSNFLYSTPRWRGLHHLVDYIKKGCVYIASHELHVCATFSRRFFWSDLNLWPEDLAPGSVVLLSGRDDLMNARQVQVMLESAGHVRVMYDADLTHGEFLIKSEIKQAIMDEVRGMLARSGSAVVGLARPVLQTTMTLARNALGGGAVRMHTARGGTKYVRDDANNLVRTFTGNLTAMLQGMATVKPPSFAAAGARLPSKSVGGLAAGAATVAAPAAGAGGLVQMSSLPVRRKAACDTWTRAIFAAAPDAPKPPPTSAGLPPVLPKGCLARRLSGPREGRRSSSSGGAPRKVVTMAADGVQVMARQAEQRIAE